MKTKHMVLGFLAVAFLLVPIGLLAQEGQGDRDLQDTAQKQEVATEKTAVEDQGEKAGGKPQSEPPAYRGSSVSLTNNVTAYSFNQEQDLTYNPYYAIGLDLSPMWWFAEYFAVTLNFNMELELTNSDWTKDKNEIFPSDVRLGMMFPVSLKDNWKITPSISGVIPTSRASGYSTLMTAITPAFGVSKTWPEALQGITLSAKVGYTQYFHESRVGEYDNLRNLGCRSEWSPSCGALLYGSSTNPMLAVPTSAGINIGLVDTFAFGFTFGYTYIHKYAPTNETVNDIPGGSGNGVNPDDLESDFSNNEELQTGAQGVHMNTYVFDFSYSPISWLGLSVGTMTSGNQLGEDSTYRAPFFNRDTMFYLNVSFLLEGFTSSDEG